ncbi:hypothetical protein C2I18_26165 [Paenibacillus sp. PK3_47]|uniref:ArsR/SmtB family transcription factor n=1 Tax=Paenibacillus sp. PK3_47 TaxID=2072642 RepID=UPI00201DFA69|nr:metalloregulator ArsR/SmtB family transcription factor [Paenibacillus sp. PK3_47]UQZ36709.1 hypothetical protein C2I18_26165 [Paenibacillus sp. PK3_47]
MNLIIQERLEPVFETMGLLYVSSHAEKFKSDMIEELNEFGVDGEFFYNRHLKILDKYIAAFMKHRVIDDNTITFFSEDNEGLFSVLLALLSENTGWLAAFDQVTEDEMQSALIRVLLRLEELDDRPAQAASAENIRSLDDIVAFLAHCPVDEKTKWKLMGILQTPRKQLKLLIDTVNTNLPAFEKASAEVAKPLHKLIRAYIQSVQKQEDEQFLKLVGMFAEEPVVYPSLIMPLGQQLFTTQCYYGLYVDVLPISGKTLADSRDFLLLRLKALGDNSKLQILASLKVSPKYNLEIAEQLGLTAATMSHHMNVLLACGLVGIEKKNGKVYYHLNQDNLRQLISDMEQFLL